jgi:hypothetical protein
MLLLSRHPPVTVRAFGWLCRPLRIIAKIALIKLLATLLVSGQPDIVHESIVLRDGYAVKLGTSAIQAAQVPVAGSPALSRCHGLHLGRHWA